MILPRFHKNHLSRVNTKEMDTISNLYIYVVESSGLRYWMDSQGNKFFNPPYSQGKENEKLRSKQGIKNNPGQSQQEKPPRIAITPKNATGF